MLRSSTLLGVALMGFGWVHIAAGQATPPAPSATRPATQPAEKPIPVASSRLAAVTVYRGTALVTRQVAVPEGKGLMELVVSPLPEQTVDSSLYTEAADGVRVLSTRYRTRAVREDAREEVRAIERHIKELTDANQELQKQTQVIEQNLALLGKLENFTAATMQSLTEKGMLNGEATITLSKYVMDSRTAQTTAQVKSLQQIQENTQAIEFAQRQMAELTAGANRTLRDAIIVVDKENAAAASVRLNYLVNAATWRPQYKLRAGKEQDPVRLEYLAAIEQQSGEDWSNVDVTLSTAEPQLSAAPPELLAMDVTVAPRGPAGGAGTPGLQPQQTRDAYSQAKALRARAQTELNGNRIDLGWQSNNTAAALEQTAELLALDDDDRGKAAHEAQEGPSVTYHLKANLTVPSRNDQQLIEVARIELAPDYFYKTVPILSPHVYRLANLTNTSDHVLLAGEATMYQGGDFVGRMNLPLVAIGESFTAGFGVDPQLQVERQLVNKSRTLQGGNQVHVYDYRIRMSSFKSAPVTVQVWDRLPRAEAESVGVSLTKGEAELSKDAAYLRAERPQNLLRWDVQVAPGMNGEKAAAVNYQFKLEYDRNLAIGNFKATK